MPLINCNNLIDNKIIIEIKSKILRINSIILEDMLKQLTLKEHYIKINNTEWIPLTPTIKSKKILNFKSCFKLWIKRTKI